MLSVMTDVKSSSVPSCTVRIVEFFKGDPILSKKKMNKDLDNKYSRLTICESRRATCEKG